MKKMRTIQIMALSVVALSFVLASCSKTDDVILNNPSIDDIADITAVTYAADVIDETLDIGDEAINLSDSRTSLKSTDAFQYKRLSECTNVTREIVDSLVIITIDFGNANCEGADGRERRGAIVATHAGNYWDDSCEVTFTFEDYFVDDNQITGYQHVVRTRNQEHNWVSNMYMEGEVIFCDSTGTMTRTAERIRTMTQGSGTREKSDDVTETTGKSVCTMENGLQIKNTIMTALMNKNEKGCMVHKVSGIEKVECGSEPTLTIDYGDGTCDNYAEVSKNGVTEVVEMKRKGKPE